MFDQVFVITVRRDRFVQPLFYALLPSRRKETCERLYKKTGETRDFCSVHLGISRTRSGCGLHGLRNGLNSRYACTVPGSLS